MALDDIIAHKKCEVNSRIDNLKNIKKCLVPSKKSLAKALAKNLGFICEIKFASPSKGLIAKEKSALKVAAIYEPFATAISVLADENFFHGSYEFVSEVSLAVNCPVLCKDVVVSPLQVYEARYYGADIVLLMLSVLSDEVYNQCAQIAQSLNMDIICEVHTKEEMLRANKLLAPIIGINNRNLKTLEINMDTSKQLASLAHKDALVILESGFSNHQQIMDYKDIANGFLVGTSLMMNERIDLALRELIFGRVKICGITNPDDAKLCYEAGAYYGGLNFASLSKRKISLDEAGPIIKAAPLIWGGVFVNQPVALVNDIAVSLGLSFVQLHGDENAAYIKELRNTLPKPTEIWCAVAVKNQAILPKNTYVDHWLLDSFSPNRGGSGQSFSWDLIKDLSLDDVILAGGINPNNVKAASALSAFAIDCASGVEEKPGKKSPHKLKEFFKNLRP
jgi:indole-3-glycerol phosphate synthase/phosphoribosylanthranilate isomerase